MSATAIVAALFVLATFGWILIDALKSHRKDRGHAVEHETGRIFHAERMKQSSVADVESRVRASMEEIARLTPSPAAPHNPEVTPSGEMPAVNPLDEETRCMKAVREKAEEVNRIVQKKAKA